jgi:peptidyl-prolyl cis-trans isomerase SurA
MRSRVRSSSILAALGLAALGAPEAASAELVDRVVAIIDRDVVTLSEAEQARAVARARTGEDVPLVTIVDRLIESRLIEREVERFSGDAVPGELVDEAFQQVRDRFDSEDDFQVMLRSSGLTEEELHSQLGRQLAVAGYLERRFRGLTFVTDEEIEAYYRNELPSGAAGVAPPDLSEVSDSIQRLLEERKFNERVEQWIQGLESRAQIRRYIW